MKQSIVFAHYKNDELLGYRCDTFGTILKNSAKIYTYSKDQVETVIKNINYTLGEKKPNLGDVLTKQGIEAVDMNGNPINSLISKREEEIYQQGQDAGAFEVRVLKCPDKIYEKHFDVEKAEWVEDVWGIYPVEEMKIWMDHPETHECIEKHYFSIVGQIDLR